MARNIENKASQLCEGVNHSSNATFRLEDLKYNFMSLLRRIKMLCYLLTKHSTLCHPEFISGSHKQEILKQVQNDIIFYLKSLGHLFIRFVKRVQGDIGVRHTFKQALAFTLAETLIVMGIIGVVAALTIPNLNSSTADKEKIAKLNKIYSNLEDAVGRAQAVYGPVEEWLSGKTPEQKNLIFYERITEFLKVQKTCAPNATGCFTKNNMNSLRPNTSITDTLQTYYQVILADGASVSLFPYANDNFCSEDGCYNFYVDIDGPKKGSFTAGKDVFVFVGGAKDGLVKSWGSKDATNKANCFKFGNTCSSWVLEFGNMDYLKADSSGKCPNGKVLDWTTNTSCK